MKELTATVKANGLLRVPNNNKATVAALFSGVVKHLIFWKVTMFAKVRLLPPLPTRNTSAYRSSILLLSVELLLPNRNLKDRTSCIKRRGNQKNLQSSSSELRTLSTQKASLARQLQMMGINPASVTNATMRTGLAITARSAGQLAISERRLAAM